MARTILVLPANPKDTEEVGVIEELDAIRKAAQESSKPDILQVRDALLPNPDEVQKEMMRKPNIVHFCGHGAKEFGLVFQDDAGYSLFVGNEVLANFFKLFSEDVECVVLNACYSEQAATAIANHIKYVVGVKGEISAKACQAFSRAFYRALGEGRPIASAFEMGRIAVALRGYPDAYALFGPQDLPQNTRVDDARSGSSSRTRLPRLTEWWLSEAGEADGFLSAVEKIKSALAEVAGQDDIDVAITFYIRSDKSVGVGSFEYDLTYCSNVIDPTLMFGPVIKDDDRISFTDNRKVRSQVFFYEKPKPGGFAAREGIKVSAWFKIGKGLWSDTGLCEDNVDPTCIDGLLFVNIRQQGAVLTKFFEDPRFIAALRHLEEPLARLRGIRNRNRESQQQELHHEFYSTGLNSLAKERALTVDQLSHFFSLMLKIIEKITAYPNLALSVYRYDSGHHRLNWLWSNGPTGIEASIDLAKYSSNPPPADTPLPALVAVDGSHRPRLVHHLQLNEHFRDSAVRTKHRDNANAALVVPILLKGEKATEPLLGIIDLQSSKNTQFNTNDSQLLYEISKELLAPLMEKIAIPPPPNIPPPPSNKVQLRFDIHQLLTLNFSPMKYLFHWDQIRQVVRDEPVAFPALVEVWPSMKCNHNCYWCRTRPDRDAYENANQFISDAALCALADEFVQQSEEKSQVDLLISGGGEPLLHEQLHSFMERVKNLRGSVGIFTNGTRRNALRFWESFFSRDPSRGHSFVRISFNGSTPDSYFRIHRPKEYDELRSDNLERAHQAYNEARKLVLDLLSMRSNSCTVALGSTIPRRWMGTVADQATDAHALGVDFIQMRPELEESARFWDIVSEVRERILAEERRYEETPGFAVKYTDAERAYRDHDYDTCYAMHLVPALIPDFNEGMIRVLPCSYAAPGGKTPPILGKMRDGVKLADFWSALETTLRDGQRAPSSKDGIEIALTGPINPKQYCPQCRYYMLNHRIIELRSKPGHVDLVTELVRQLKMNDDCAVSPQLATVISNTWPSWVIDVDAAQKAFRIARELEIRPSL